MSMKLAEYTTSTYDLTLTSATVNSSSRLEYGTESTNYTYTVSSSASGTYWKSELQDSRSATSSTFSTTGITVSTTSFTEAEAAELQSSTISTTVSKVFGGKLAWQDTYIETWSRSMGYLNLAYATASAIVTVSSYGNYTSRTTTYSNKIRTDTTVTSTIYKTTANVEKGVVSISRTDTWYETLKSYSSTTDIEYLYSRGVKSSLIYTESGSTYRAGNNYYNVSTTSQSSLEITKLSGTLYESETTRYWSSEDELKTTIPAESIKFTSLWLETLIDWDDETYTYETTCTRKRTTQSSSVSYLNITLFPKKEVYSVDSATHSYVHEWISYTDEHTAENLYLGSQSLSLISQASASTMVSESYSGSWLDREISWSFSDSNGHTVQGFRYVSSQHADYFYEYTTDTFNGSEFTTTTKYGRAEYATYAIDCTSVAFRSSTTYTASIYSTLTGYSTTSFSSTTFTGEFSMHNLSTVMSGSTSTIAFRHASRSVRSVLASDSWESPEDRYAVYDGTGSTTYA